MVLLLSNKTSMGTTTTTTTTIEIDLSIAVVSTLTVKSNGSCSSSSSGVSSKSSSIESTCGDSCSNDGSSLDSTSLITSSSSSSSSSASSTTSSTTSTPVKKSERLLAKSVAKGGHSSSSEVTKADSTSIPPEEGICMWRECSCIVGESITNILDHIQTIHVAPQTKTKGFFCLWEGCKVYNKKSSSLSWIERHVLTHSGNKPFRCIFSGCGISFGSQGALERHVNSHITTTGNHIGTSAHPVTRKLDSSPTKTLRRKKVRTRKQKLNTGQFVDFFDKGTIEVIKYRLSRSVQVEERNPHNCTFTCQVLSRRMCSHEEPHLLVRWYPLYILPDEWIPQSKFVQEKVIPFRQLPPEKVKLLFPSLFPPDRKEKAKRKWKPPKSLEMDTELSSEGTQDMKPLFPEDSITGPTKLESICDRCNYQKSNESACHCVPLDPDWASFLREQYW